MNGYELPGILKYAFFLYLNAEKLSIKRLPWNKNSNFATNTVTSDVTIKILNSNLNHFVRQKKLEGPKYRFS